MQNAKPKLLVLDGQGVVFDAPIRKFLMAFTRKNKLNFERVSDRWEARLRKLAWTGAIGDEALWNELAGRQVDFQRTMLALSASYRQGPVAAHLGTWSQQVPIWLLSNHRSHWVMPHLCAYDLDDVFDRILFSDVTGLVKPDPGAFKLLLNGKTAPGDILFVDDQLHNITAAEKLGISSIHATPEHDWVNEISVSLAA